jgi:hypothetical protein
MLNLKLTDKKQNTLIGVLDGLLFLVYFFNVDNFIYYVVSISIKLLIINYNYNKKIVFTHSAKNNYDFYLLVVAAELISAIYNDVGVMSSMKTVAFVVNLATTVCFVSAQYWRGLFCVGVINAFVYLMYVSVGKISDHYGRLMYFNESHFNLGTEIFMAAAFASVFIRPGIFVIACNILFFYCTNLMQGRAGQLSIAISILICFNLFRKRINISNKLLYIMLVGGLYYIIINIDIFYDLLNNAMRIDDDQRGAGTNASGRSDYWGVAINLWKENFIFGVGSDYVVRLGVIQAHNFFLYPLVFYGIAGFAILFVLLKKFFIGAFVPDLFIYLPILPMIIFNDRFINLNIYPVILYLVLITRYDEIQIFGLHDRVE